MSTRLILSARAHRAMMRDGAALAGDPVLARYRPWSPELGRPSLQLEAGSRTVPEKSGRRLRVDLRFEETMAGAQVQWTRRAELEARSLLPTGTDQSEAASTRLA